jgi:hypothetical protein
MTLLDELVPVWDFDERHGIRTPAPAASLLEALRAVTPGETPLLRALFRARGLPALADRPILEQMLARGFFLLGERPGVELVAGAIGQPWRVTESLRRGVDFASFDEPGYVKMALGFLARDGELVTETRVLATDDGARRRFRPYWLAVRPASGITRRSWLAAAARRA